MFFKSIQQLTAILTTAILIGILTFPASSVALSAEASIVVDVESERVLYEQNADTPMRIASLTKIMTAIVAIENGNLEDVVTVSKRAHGVDGSSIYLQLDEKLKLKHLLYGMMLRSGNDAATAIAEHIGSNVEGFVKMMNEKAKQLKMKNTKFINPHGLDERKGSNFSTARDMAKLTAYALKDSTFAEIVSTKFYEIPLNNRTKGRKLYNKNRMLYSFEGADGVKTGYTILARRCLASSATRDGWQLASIVLRAPNWYQDSSYLLNQAFKKYRKVWIAVDQSNVGEIPVIDGKKEQVTAVLSSGFSYPVTDEEEKYIKKQLFLEKKLSAPVEQGEKVGELQIYFKDQLVKKLDVVSIETVDRLNWWEKIRKKWVSPSKN
ncbi:D-alanyl-D-alanine carboxypeptidase [Microaerobacter geothermalis]|uniref:D-alanyl-D-alanine carboxypeptidase family protein n=1 Tax=Microaerobacter geothermalis TaxID=674972 RepID=UPI001F3559F4|nr:D-alanyl-D-alanine carboxypeptidase family protein [Microaerobacter geothermalis]MCF6093121.1 D-alanyl-D-alanine carboxypeptidase [Microaerobacter geothermalis]